MTRQAASGAGRVFLRRCEMRDAAWGDPSTYFDRRTSLYDAEIAMRLEYGVPERYIHPGTGEDLTPTEICRHCWTPAETDWVCPDGVSPGRRYHPLCAAVSAIEAQLANRASRRGVDAAQWDRAIERTCREQITPILAGLGLASQGQP